MLCAHQPETQFIVLQEREVQHKHKHNIERSNVSPSPDRAWSDDGDATRTFFSQFWFFLAIKSHCKGKFSLLWYKIFLQTLSEHCLFWLSYDAMKSIKWSKQPYQTSLWPIFWGAVYLYRPRTVQNTKIIIIFDLVDTQKVHKSQKFDSNLAIFRQIWSQLNIEIFNEGPSWGPSSQKSCCLATCLDLSLSLVIKKLKFDPFRFTERPKKWSFFPKYLPLSSLDRLI